MLYNLLTKEVTADNDRKIRVYDDVFDFMYRQEIYTFAANSLFRIGWADGAILENQHHRFLHSPYSEEDIQSLNLMPQLLNSKVAQELQGYKLQKAILNLSTASDSNFVHVHPEDKVLLYYVNLEWRDGWHGETLFFNDNAKDIVFASPYMPGRLISFDAKIPHTIRPQSHIAVHYRFTLAMVFNKDN
jgi:hypothetical protein